MYKIQKFSKNRQFIYDLLYRAKTFHMSFSANIEIDCTEAERMLAELKAQGQQISFAAFMARATAVLIEQNPHLNRHLFTKWTGKKVIVQFDDINCNMVMQREAGDGEKILLPLIIKQANKKSLKEIQDFIQFNKVTPLKDLPQFKGYELIKKMPLLLMKYISYKTRSDPDFYIKYYGTYGLTTPSNFKNPILSGHGIANTVIAFSALNIYDQGDRRILRLTYGCDHYVLDGQEIAEAGYKLKYLIENPKTII